MQAFATVCPSLPLHSVLDAFAEVDVDRRGRVSTSSISSMSYIHPCVSDSHIKTKERKWEGTNMLRGTREGPPTDEAEWRYASQIGLQQFEWIMQRSRARDYHGRVATTPSQMPTLFSSHALLVPR